MQQYRRYSDDVKEMIIRTRNLNLFPERGNPRTTALYWIEKSGKTRKLSAAKSGRDAQVMRVASELNKETYKISVLSKVLREDLRRKGRDGRRAIVEMVDKGKSEYGINYTQFCRILGIHLASFALKIMLPILYLPIIPLTRIQITPILRIKFHTLLLHPIRDHERAIIFCIINLALHLRLISTPASFTSRIRFSARAQQH